MCVYIERTFSKWGSGLYIDGDWRAVWGDQAEIFRRLSIEVYPGDVGDLIGEIAIWRVSCIHRCRGGENLAMSSFHV